MVSYPCAFTTVSFTNNFLWKSTNCVSVKSHLSKKRLRHYVCHRTSCVLNPHNIQKNETKETSSFDSTIPLYSTLSTALKNETITGAEQSIQQLLRNLHTLSTSKRINKTEQVLSLLSSFNNNLRHWSAIRLITNPNPSFIPDLIKSEQNDSSTSLYALTRSIRTFCSRILSQLDRQRLALSYSFSETQFQQDLRNLISPRNLQRAQAVILQNQPHRGLCSRVNTRWGAIPFRLLPALTSFHSAPCSYDQKLRLTYVSRNSRPAKAARNAAHVVASTCWKLLGLAENDGPLPTSRIDTLTGWRAAVQSYDKPTLHERLCEAYLPNAIIAYAHAMRRKMLTVSSVPNGCEAVSLQEVGVYLHTIAKTVLLAASPAAMVCARKEEDFWMLSSKPFPLISAVQPPFTQLSENICQFQLNVVSKQLGIREWVEAQITMQCCGEDVEEAHVVLYAPYGGTTVFRVEKDVSFLQLANDKLIDFVEEYVWKSYPPPRDFQMGNYFDRLLEHITKGCENAEILYSTPADVVEAGLWVLRDQMTDWESNRSKNVFWQRNTSGNTRKSGERSVTSKDMSSYLDF